MSTHPLINIATNAALRAGRLIANSLERLSTIVVNEKQANDYVTEIDIRSEQMIIETIHKAYPNHAILAEESGSHGENDTVWIIDPLDGTRNFVHGFPHFSISIAIQQKGKIEHATIYDPIRQELFTATRGHGAQLNAHRVRVSERHRLEKALIGTGFPFKDREAFKLYLKGFEELSLQGAITRRSGSAALDLAYVAAGRLDGYWGYDLQPWDMAAGMLLVKEAGGLISDVTGQENQLATGNIIAGNPKIFKAMLQILGSKKAI